jgi:hypothetical protein
MAQSPGAKRQGRFARVHSQDLQIGPPNTQPAVVKRSPASVIAPE